MPGLDELKIVATFGAAVVCIGYSVFHARRAYVDGDIREGFAPWAIPILLAVGGLGLLAMVMIYTFQPNEPAGSLAVVECSGNGSKSRDFVDLTKCAADRARNR